MLEWLRNLLPHHSQGSNRERWSLRGSLTSPLFLIIQWIWQRHLTWSSTQDVVSREINLWKSFDFLFEPVTVGTKCRMLNH